MARRLVMVALTLGGLAHGFEVRHDSTGTPVRWAREVEFVLDARLEAQLGAAQAEAAMRSAVSAVSAAVPGVAVRLRRGQTAGVGFALGRDVTNQNDICALDLWPYDDAVLAATVLTLNTKTHEIVDADIAINTQDNRFDALDEHHRAHPNAHDIQNMMTHELGHAFGLLHNHAEPRAVMFPQSPAGEVSKRTLADDDRAGLAFLYADTLAPGALTPLATRGCSAADVGLGGVACLLFALRRRRVLAGAVAGLVAVSVVAAPSPPPSDRAAWVGTVESSTTAVHDGRFVSTLVVRRGAEVELLRLPGGRVGDFEQVIGDHPVPEVGTSVSLRRAPSGKHQLVAVFR